MIDKADVKVPYSATFKPDFKFVAGELRYAGSYTSPVKKSMHYAGVVDLRPFGAEAILHAFFKRSAAQNHKLELIDAGEKSIEHMAHIISKVFDANPYSLEMMRIDFAADLHDIPVMHLYQSLRVKGKRSANAIGEREYETVGGRRLEYFRYGKAPNCVRVYDKPAECKARLPQILKRVSRDAEIPTFEDLFGFPENATITRVECQSGGGRMPEEVCTFGDLKKAADFNPFDKIEVVPNEFPKPDPRRIGPSRSVKLIGTYDMIKEYGFQQARAMLNCDGNGKRFFDDYEAYLAEVSVSIMLTVGTIYESYRETVRKQIDGSIYKRSARPIASNPETDAALLVTS